MPERQKILYALSSHKGDEKILLVPALLEVSKK